LETIAGSRTTLSPEADRISEHQSDPVVKPSPGLGAGDVAGVGDVPVIINGMLRSS